RRGLNSASNIWWFSHDELVHYRLTRIHADAQTKFDIVFLLKVDVEVPNSFDDAQSGQHRTICIVFMGNGVTEVVHEAITHTLAVVILIFLDDPLRNLMEIIDRVAQVF